MFRLFGIAIMVLTFLSMAIGSEERTSYAKSPTGEEPCRFDGTGLSFMGHIGGTPTEIARANGYSYLAVGPELLVVDDHIPTAPQIVARKIFPYIITDLALAEDKIAITYRNSYPTGCSGGLWLGQIYTSAGLETIGEIRVDTPTTVSLYQQYAYVTTDNGELNVYDTSDSVRRVGSVQAPVLARQSAVGNNVLVIAHNTRGLHLYNVLNPTQPALVGTYKAPLGVAGADIYGTVALLYDNKGIQLVDISNPVQPQDISRVNVNLPVQEAWFSGDYLYYSARSCEFSDTPPCYGEFKRLNQTNPNQPTMTYRLETPGRFELENGILYLLDFRGGYQIVAEQDIWEQVGELALPGSVATVAHANDTVWIQESLGRLRGLQQTAPFCLRGSIDNPEFYPSRTLASNEEYLYFPHSGDYLQVVDVQNPDNPVLAGGLRDSSIASMGEIAFEEGYAYWNGGKGLNIASLADPRHPTVVGRLAYPMGKIEVENNFVYTGNYTSWQIIDATTPTSPVLRGSNTNQTDDTLTNGTIAYTASRYGIIIYDVSNPDVLKVLGELSLYVEQVANIVQVDETHLVILYTNGVIKLIDVSDPTNPQATGEWVGIGGGTQALAHHNGYLYVAATQGGLYVFRYATPQSPTGSEQVYLPLTYRTPAQTPVGCP
jgi:hypothetical protein